ncbi:MAG: 3-oxoacyl-ACP reductase FabG [Proteobacteria bacterium]|jgi:3-oxoacyl-[acyl-carrier protein] reductase|nr:3-oxoacyl-ACP reductase FabG [Pseudomonadota bacterium]
MNEPVTKELQPKVCLVTGASRGIGKAIAIELGNKGYTVIGTATTQGDADNICGYLAEAGITGQGQLLNVNNADQVTSLFKSIAESYEAPLVLVNNAGIARDNLLMRMKEEEWDDILNTNLKSVYRLSKAALRAMTKARFGRIISITSVIGVSGNAGQSNYAAAKAGIIGFSKSLAQEVGSRGITVNTVAPGFIQTDMTDALSEDQKSALLLNIPARRLGEPEDVASAVAYLASDEASYINGVTLHVNGGMYMS